MLDRNNLVALMKQVAKADRSAPVSYSFNGENFSYDQLNETLRRELNEYAGTYSLYRENKNLIFSLIEETINEILPKKVEQAYMQFAETELAVGDLLAPNAIGLLSKSGDLDAMKWQVVKLYTMPDNQKGVKIMRIA